MKLPLLPTLIIVAVLALAGPTIAYYVTGGTPWWAYLSVAPLLLVVLYLLASAVSGGLRDGRGK